MHSTQNIPLAERVLDTRRNLLITVVAVVLEALVIGSAIRLGIAGSNYLMPALMIGVMGSMVPMFFYVILSSSYARPMTVTKILRLGPSELEVVDRDGASLGSLSRGEIRIAHGNGQVWINPGTKYRQLQLSAVLVLSTSTETLHLFPRPVVGPHPGIPTADLSRSMELTQAQYFAIAAFAPPS